jgi:hypothetical protein
MQQLKFSDDTGQSGMSMSLGAKIKTSKREIFDVIYTFSV